VDALGGDPGVYTADWAGVPRDFNRAMKRVEDALQAAGANSPGQRRGSFNATLCLAHPDGRDVLYVGKCEGTLVWPPRGELGHGYDPMFMPDGHDITFGEMAAETKHSWSPGEKGLSHRARAFAQFVENQIDHG
jgi:XTP/dITP diphosphohydrolase